jgi:phage-related holin
MGIMFGGFRQVVVMVVMAVTVSDCTVSMIVMVVNGKLKSRLKWSRPNRGIILVFAWRN